MDFYFDYSCPYAYLAFTQLARLEAQAGQSVRMKPMLLGGVFAANGTPQNLMNVLGQAKAQHNFADMQRWARVFGVPLRIPSEHPRRTVEALRATLLTGVDREVVTGFYRAYWELGRAPSDEATIRDVLGAAGHDAHAVLARMGDADLKQALRDATDEAIGKGIFGAPSFVRDDGELFWGQDRMHLAFDLPIACLFSGRSAMHSREDGAVKMSTHTIDLYWDFSSPYAYLASTQAEALAARTGATLVWHPMLLGGVFKAIGQADAPLLAFSEAKRAYMLRDLHRWAAYWKVPFRFPTRFPMNTVKALRVYLALPEARRADFRAASFRALWADDRDISDDAVLRELAADDSIIERISDPAIKQALFAATDQALKAGVFGAPTFIVDGKELYWGQDRMPLMEAALTQA